MLRSAGMNLVFRLGKFGFSLSLDDLLEIREEPVDFLAGDEDRSFPYCLGFLTCRGQEIPVIDLKGLFQIQAEPDKGDLRSLLILVGESGYWGVPVSQILGFFSLKEFSDCYAPLLSLFPGPRPYRDLELWHEEPLVHCDLLLLEQFWCGA